MKKIKITIILLSFLMIFACARAPKYNIALPWVKISKIDNNAFGKTFDYSIEIDGKNDFLLSSKDITANEITNEIDKIFARKGYTKKQSNNSLKFILKHSTEKDTEHNLAVNIKTYHNSNNEPNSLLGLTLQIMNDMNGDLASNSTIKSATELVFRHNINLMLVDSNNQAIWQGQSFWTSQNADLTKDLAFPLKLVTAEIPIKPEAYPKVNLIKENRTEDYYKANINKFYFKCPSLPGYIKFPSTEEDEQRAMKYKLIKDQKLEIYTDLITNCFKAVPIGRKNYDDVTNKQVWSQAIIANKYLIGNNPKPQNVLIRLKGNGAYYIIAEAKIASDEEFEQYQVQYKKWQKALKDYYSFYE